MGLLCILVLLSGCQDEIIDEVLKYSDYRAGLYAPIDQDEVTMVPGHGKDSFSPYVEGFVWKVNIEGYEEPFFDILLGEAIVDTIELDPEYPTYYFIRLEDLYGDGYHEYEGSGSGGGSQGNSIHFIPSFLTHYHHNNDYFMTYDKAQSKLGENITTSYNHVGYMIEETITYGDEFESFTTQFGKRYDTCLHVTRSYTFPQGNEYEPYITFEEYYIAKGVGFVYLKSIYNTGDETQLVLVDHSSFGETLTFDMNTTDTVSKTIAPRVYEEGEQITLPEVNREGYILSSWLVIVDDQEVGPYEPGSSFSMGDKDVTMKAIWIAE